jgi:hypothetical protein
LSIYLPDELGERVKKANLEVSRICQNALTREVELAEAARRVKGKGPFERIIVSVGVAGRPVIVKAFHGRWLVDGMTSNIEVEEPYRWSIALTRRGAFAVYLLVVTTTTDQEGTVTTVSDQPGTLTVFDSLAEAATDPETGQTFVPEDVLAAAHEALGVNMVIELDI